MHDDTHLTEEYLDGSVVFPGHIIRLEHWQVLLPNGETALREIACHPGASAVVALDEKDNIILVRQHRIAVGRVTMEIPAGKLDSPDEDPFLCAKRELEEETGFRADHWEKLTCLETTPGFCNERIHIYLATELSEQEAHPDANVIWGLAFDESLDDEMRVTIIATGFDHGILNAPVAEAAAPSVLDTVLEYNEPKMESAEEAPEIITSRKGGEYISDHDFDDLMAILNSKKNPR